MRLRSSFTPLVIYIAMSVSACSPAAAPSKRPPIERQAASALTAPIAWQRIYVPAYSEIHAYDAARTTPLAATLSIRNTDEQTALIVTAVRYHGDDGQLLRDYITTPFALKPLASTEFVIDHDDLTGGISPSFIIEWMSAQPVYAPVIETVMVGTGHNRGISFVSAGRVLAGELPPR